MKTLIWFLAILGIVGPCLFAAVRLLTSTPQAPNSNMVDEPWLLSSVGVSVPGFSLELSVLLWPSVLVMVGAILFLIGLFFLIPKQVGRTLQSMGVVMAFARRSA